MDRVVASIVALFIHLVAGADVIVRARPDGPACPDPEEVRQSLSRQLASGNAMQGWTILYSPAGSDEVAVEVAEPGGVVRARRTVAIDRRETGACVAAAETIAAIGVRAFQPLAWAAAPAIDAAAPAAIVADAPASSTPPSPRLRVAVGPALVSAPSANVNVLVDVGVRLFGQARAHVGGFALPMRHSEAAGLAGRAHLTRVQTDAALTWTFPAGRREIELGPILGIAIDHGWTVGLTVPSSGYRATWSGGVTGAASWALTPRWRLGIALVAWAGGPAGDFLITTDDKQRPALRGSTVGGFGALRVEGTIFP